MKPIFFFDRRVEVEDVCEVLRALGKPVPTCRECEHGVFRQEKRYRDRTTWWSEKTWTTWHCRYRGGEVNPRMTARVKWEKRKEE